MTSHHRFLTDPKNIDPLLPPEVLVESLIERGGQGAVFRGQVADADAAVKVYLPGQVQKRVDREVDALGRLSSDKIVRLLWHGSVSVPWGDQLQVVATEFVEGTTLKHELANYGPLSSERVARLGADVATAISEMWSLRIVHRDLKPGNIILRPEGEACVIDLGLARHLDQSSLTVVGATWGTLGYLSPEQTRALRQLTCKSDIFTLGLILLEAGLGRHPTGGDQLALNGLTLHRRLPEPLNAWSQEGVLRSALEERPTRRPMPLKFAMQLKATL